MLKWFLRILAVIAVLVLAGVGYGAWRFGHPALPADSQTLPAVSAAGSGLTAQYFGTTTLAFRDGHNAVMVDALLTRPDMKTVLSGVVASNPALIDSILRRASIDKLDLLLISHTHYDHVLDADAVAQRTGATIVGSASTREVALGGGIPAARIATITGHSKHTGNSGCAITPAAARVSM